MCFLEVAVDANVNDILSFLEKDNQVISPHNYPSENPDGLDISINFHIKREGNAISVCTKIYTTQAGKLYPKCYEDDPDGQGNEVIRFEVARLTDTRSLVKGLYQEDNSDFELMFWKRLVRLGIAFNGRFVHEAQIRLAELEQLESQWGWHESEVTLFGNKARIYGPTHKREQKNTIQ